MKTKFILILFLTLIFSISCQSQTNKSFTDMLKLFPEMKVPLKYKDEAIGAKIKHISEKDAIMYLHFTEDDLRMNDFDYNFDEDIKYDHWVEVLPGALGKISKTNYVTLVFALLKSPTIGIETYIAKLSTFSYEGQVIDSIIIRSQYTPENDWRDVVFVEQNIFRIFDYTPNSENYNIKDGIYYLIDEKQPKTIVEINDYQIDENGKITLIKTSPKRYLKEFVSFYRNYQKDSDDPMNEY